MPRGFAGKSVEKFFTNTEEALERAGEAHNKNPFERHRSNGSVPLPNLPPTHNQPAPFTSSDAWTGGPHGRNVGDSSSVVVDTDVYNAVIQRADMVDHQSGGDMYAMCNTIDEICETIFVVPETSPRIAAITDQFKKSLGHYRSLTEELAICVRRYTNEISNIDHGSMDEVAMVKAASSQAIGRVSSSADRQISSMERTSESYKNQAKRLSEQAQREYQRADRLRLAAAVPTGAVLVDGFGF